jgi:hypothetical protein
MWWSDNSNVLRSNPECLPLHAQIMAFEKAVFDIKCICWSILKNKFSTNEKSAEV